MEIAASLNDFSSPWCKQENVEPEALKEWRIYILLIIVAAFQFTLVILLPTKPKFLFVTLSPVSGIFICCMFWFQQIKLQITLSLFDDCIM